MTEPDKTMPSPILLPNPDDTALTRRMSGIDHTGAPVEAAVTVERALTLFLNGQEIVTMMTIGDYPDCLAVGYLTNQNMLRADDTLTGVTVDQDKGHIFVTTARRTDYEWKLKRRTLTSGCAQGTAFGDVMERFDQVVLDDAARLRTGSMPCRGRSTRRRRSISPQARSTAACCANATGR